MPETFIFKRNKDMTKKKNTKKKTNWMKNIEWLYWNTDNPEIKRHAAGLIKAIKKALKKSRFNNPLE